jgi:transaldolase
MGAYKVSVEVTEKKPEDVYMQAKKIVALAPNIIVKIPCSVEYYAVIGRLVKEEVPLNITLVFSLVQMLMMAQLGVQYISPFIGRLDDIDSDGMALVRDGKSMIERYKLPVQIIAASIRTVRHLHEVICAGVDIATVPAAVLEASVQHPLTKKGIALFDAEWQKLGVKQFP